MAIRAVAERRKTFTAQNIPVSLYSAVNSCRYLAARGELVKVVTGRPGRFGFVRPIYKASRQLRKPALTNRWL